MTQHQNRKLGFNPMEWTPPVLNGIKCAKVGVLYVP